MCKLLKIKNSRLSERQIKMGLIFFVAGTSAETAAELIGIHRNSATRFYDYLRRVIAKYITGESPFFDGGIERVYAQVIPDAKTETLMPMIRNKIRPDSIIYTGTFNS